MRRRPSVRATRLAGIALGLAGLIAPGPGCRREAEVSPETGTAVAVTVQPAQTQTLRDALVSAGTIVPAAAGDFTATALEAGEIAELPKAEGDGVQAGDVLVRFDIPAVTNEINTRQLEVTMAKSKADAARTEAARMTSLHERGLTSRNSMEASRVALTDAEAALTQAQGLLDAIKAQEQQRTIVRARFAGIVAKVWHTKGEFVAVPGEPIVRVIDPNRTQVVIRVPLSDYQRVLPGQAASVQPPGGSSLPATVVMRTAPTDLAATTAEVRLDLPGPTALPLDTPVQVEILIEERRDVLTVPAAAVQRETTPFVWIAGEDGRAHRRDVRVGLLSGGRAQILSGLTAGERVIVTGIGELNEGIAIRIS